MEQTERIRDLSNKPELTGAKRIQAGVGGHPVLNPDGLTIRIPAAAFAKLRILGLLERAPGVKLLRISDRVFHYLEPDFDFLLGLRKLLGPDVDGPEWVQCRCRQCLRIYERADRTPAPSARMVRFFTGK